MFPPNYTSIIDTLFEVHFQKSKHFIIEEFRLIKILPSRNAYIYTQNQSINIDTLSSIPVEEHR